MNRHNVLLARHAASDMSAMGWVMIAYSSNCLTSPGWLGSIAEGDSIINATLRNFTLLEVETKRITICLISSRYHTHKCTTWNTENCVL